MVEAIVTWLLALLRRERFEIGRHGLPRYLTRWTLLGRRFAGESGKLFLHLFHRGDAEAYPHDHPWEFWSLILWGGYWEHTPADPDNPAGPTVRKWYGPGRLLKRPAEWRHRVELPAGRQCWTLIWTGPKVRGWGFHCQSGFRPWREHAVAQERTGNGCG